MSSASSIGQRTRNIFAPTGTVPPAAAPVAPVVPPAVPPVSSLPVNSFDPVSPAQPTDLALLEQAIAEAEQLVPQAVPTAMLQVVADAQAADAAQVSLGSGGKETTLAVTTATETLPTQAVIESGQSVQYVEHEPNPELPPEVEGYLNRVEQHADQAPHEIVIADTTQAMPMAHQLPAQPVVVLPITSDVEAIGAKKSPAFSIRWLVEWSHKIMKMFVGKVIYRQSVA